MASEEQPKTENTKPFLVVAGSVQEYEDWCVKNNVERAKALPVFQPFQLAFYPDHEIVYTGTYWLNACFNSPELNAYKASTAMRFGEGNTPEYAEDFEDWWRIHATQIVGQNMNHKEIANYVFKHR